MRGNSGRLLPGFVLLAFGLGIIWIIEKETKLYRRLKHSFCEAGFKLCDLPYIL